MDKNMKITKGTKKQNIENPHVAEREAPNP